MSAKVLPQPYRPQPPPVRSIRFAPLPDPRRSPSLLDSPVADDASSASSSSSSSLRRRRVSYPVESYPSPALASPLQADPDDYDPPKSKRKFLLLPIFRKSGSGSASPSSSLSLTPTPSIDNSHTKQASRRFHISAEDILTLGTIKLFRSVYRNNRYSIDNGTPSEWELSRWASINSAQSAPAATLNNTSILGPSLARSQSGRPLSSKGNDSRRRSSSFAPSVTNGGKPSYIKQTPRQGMRMLNGRVYGAPKRAADPFANVRDEADPQFVEWGYGGMGSVSGRHAAGMGGTRWERLHSGQGLVEPALDDGGGMGWVKKRREAKERERKLKEQEKEGFDDSTKGAAEGNTVATNVESTSSATPSAANTEDTGLKPSIDESFPPPNTRLPCNYAMPSEGEHVLHAVTIPANFQRHHHHHHHHHHPHRSTSRGSPVPDANDDAMARLTSDHRVENISESAEESEWGDNEEEESDAGGMGRCRRKTALGAGVEKYTRHREMERDPTIIPSVAG